MPKNAEKHAFIEHSLSVLKCYQRSQQINHEAKSSSCVPMDHPFYSQYNRLKTENFFKVQQTEASLDKSSRSMLDNVCQKEFIKYTVYRMKCSSNEKKTKS